MPALSAQSRDRNPIGYREAVEGEFVLVPEGEARTRLATGSDRMPASGLRPRAAGSVD